MKAVTQLVFGLAVASLSLAQPHGLRRAQRQDRQAGSSFEQTDVDVNADTTISPRALVTSSDIPILEPIQDIVNEAAQGFVPGPPSSVPSHNSDHSLDVGVTYSPYTAEGNCKTQQEVDSDLDMLRVFPFVRIYGVDCNQTSMVTSAAKQRNMRVFTGVFDLNNFPNSLNPIIEAAANDWSTFHTISVGNELVNNGQNSPADVVKAVNTARSVLRAKGYTGPVVTVDTAAAMIKHPELCGASDYCAANCHAFFNAYATPEMAGHWVKSEADKISKAAGGKRTMITESGWPHAGDPNGSAVPSPENQRTAIQSLRDAFSHGGIVLFSAFDDLWKKNHQGTFGAEQFWGIVTP